MEECTNKLPEPWFKPVILESPTDPAGFQDWTKGITYNKYHIILPDKSKSHAKLFLDHQGVFNSGSYTTYLINRYNELF
jgi:hypothetical protein